MHPPLVQPAADDFLAGKEPIRPRAIDDDLVVLKRPLVEQPSALEAEADRLEEAGRGADPGAERLILAGRRRPILEIEVVAFARLSLGRPAVGERGGARRRAAPPAASSARSQNVRRSASLGYRRPDSDTAAVSTRAVSMPTVDATQPIEADEHEHRGDDAAASRARTRPRPARGAAAAPPGRRSRRGRSTAGRRSIRSRELLQRGHEPPTK